ncbi:alpha-1,3/1,6-mannosyltransferase ALG2 [Syncephalis plumigaleata]|nr:alpha-1,3/1,6-mannosyltransferase ALG2 [Syncephalis plumigaleata]
MKQEQQQQQQATTPPRKPLQILVLHPDLGIGGAERLVVDAAVGLQSIGHNVVVYTNHHDPTHCFEETRDGTLQVHVYGDFLPRSVFGRCMVLCAIVRAVYLAIAVTLIGVLRQADVVFCDQVSAWIPILKYAGARVFFYCHFPDLLLSNRGSILKAIYRWPVDTFEEVTTGMADSIAVNSKFTADIFKRTFTRLSHTPQVLYPGIRLDAYDRPVDPTTETLAPLKRNERTTIVSINRFERKKNIALAIRAFVKLRDDAIVSNDEFQQLRLVIAGGYDKRVIENVEYLAELDQLAKMDYNLVTYTAWDHTLSTPEHAQVVFLPSFDEVQRSYLLDQARCLVYTPSGEHFGIVPVEAMYAKLPVVAVADGGPTETVLNDETGYLCQANPTEFATAIGRLLSKEASATMGEQGREWVRRQFTLTAFVDRLDEMLSNLAALPKSREHSLLEPLLLFVLSVLMPFFVFLYFY